MKVKELIENLKKCDPEAEVIADGMAIFFIEEQPGYYDGSYQVLIQDKNNPYYNIKGVEFTRAFKKVKLHLMNFEDVIHAFDDENYINSLIFKFDQSLDEKTKKQYEQKVKAVMLEALANLKGDKK